MNWSNELAPQSESWIDISSFPFGFTGDLVNTFRSPCPLLTLKIEGNVAVTAGSNGNVFILNSNDGQLIDTLTEDFATSQGLELLRNR